MLPLVREVVCGNNNLFEDGWENSTTFPQVTKCGQHTDLSTIPSFFLLFFSPLVFYELYSSRHSHLRSFSPISLRIIFCCLILVDLTVTIIYDFSIRFFKYSSYDAVHFYGDIVQYAGCCLVLVLTIACRNRGITTSGVITLYWLLVVICGIPELRYYLSEYVHGKLELDLYRAILYAVAFSLSSLELFLCCFADTPRNEYPGKKSCPEYSVSFFNQLTFEWFSHLAYVGNKKTAGERRPLGSKRTR